MGFPDDRWYQRPPGVPARTSAGGVVARLADDGRVMVALTRELRWRPARHAGGPMLELDARDLGRAEPVVVAALLAPAVVRDLAAADLAQSHLDRRRRAGGLDAVA